MIRAFKPILAGALSALVFLGAPGLRAYAAAAEIVRVEAVAPRLSLAIPAASADSPDALSAPALLSPAAFTSGLPDAAVPVEAAAEPSASAPESAEASASPVVSAARALQAPVSASASAEESAVSRGAHVFDLAAENRDAADVAPAPSAPEPAAKIPRSVWGLFLGHDLLTVTGVNFHMVAQPFLVTTTLGYGAATMGFVRNTHMTSMGLVNILPIGYLLDHTDYRPVLIGTALMRALLMGAIPLLFAAGHLYLPALLLVVALNPLFQSATMVANTAARNVFLGKDEKLVKDATAVLSKWDSLVGMLTPVIAGTVIAAIVHAIGIGGYAAAYGVYSALLFLSIPVYWRMIRDPRFPENDRIGPLGMARLTLRFLGGLFGAAASPLMVPLRWAYSHFRREGLVGGLLSAARAIADFVRAVRAPKSAEERARPWALRAADSLDRSNSTQGFAAILRSRVLSVLTGVMAVEMLLCDAIPFILLPSFISEFLSHPPTSLPFSGAIAAAAAGAFALLAAARAFTPKVGKALLYTMGGVAAVSAAVWLYPGLFLDQLATAGGILGLLFAAEYVGRYVSSLALESAAGDKLIAKWGHGRFYKMAAGASLLYWLLWALPMFAGGSFWIAFGTAALVLGGIQLFHNPVYIVMAPVLRAEMDDDKLARIESAMSMVDLIAESVGALLLGLILDTLGLHAVLLTAALSLTATGILQWMVPEWLSLDGKRPAPKPKT